MSKLEGNIKRFIRQNNVIHKKEAAQKYESDFLKRFDVIMGKQMIPLIFCLDSDPDVIKAIDLTLKYIQEILNLIPPQDCFDRLFRVWNGMLGKFEEYRVAFFKEISKIVSQRMAGERRDLPKEAERVYRYVLQYLKYTTQKEVDKRKLKIQIKDCCWSREWVEQLHYTEFRQVCIRCEIPQDEDSLPSCIMEYVPFSIEQKRYLGGSKEFEDTLRKILKEMKQSYFKN